MSFDISELYFIIRRIYPLYQDTYEIKSSPIATILPFIRMDEGVITLKEGLALDSDISSVFNADELILLGDYLKEFAGKSANKILHDYEKHTCANCNSSDCALPANLKLLRSLEEDTMNICNGWQNEYHTKMLTKKRLDRI